MHLIGTIVIGFVVGLIARAIHPGNDKMGFILTTVIGIGGALLASYAGQAMGLYGPEQPTGFIGAVVGSIVLLVLIGIIRNRSR